MTRPPSSDRRLLPLESLRALAAFQVLLLHMFSAFLPMIVLDEVPSSDLARGIHQSLLFYFYDGYSAVYIFFVLSGYVLTAPFLRDADRPVRVLAARWVRLAIPALAACVLAAAVMALLPEVHVVAGTALGSPWLAHNWVPDPGPLAFWRDYFTALFVGYQDGTVASFGFRPDWLPHIQTAYVAPLWTIGIEFVGSVLVFVLAAVRRRAPRLWLPLMAVALLVFFRTPYLCFIVGHIAAVMALAERPTRVPSWLCIVGILVGVILCVAGENRAVPGSEAVCTANIPFMLNCDLILHFQKRIGALIVFLAVVQWQDARNWLASPFLARLGRISFPVYLVHWPLVFGPCCVIYLAAVAAGMPSLAASGAAIIAGIALTIAVAVPFARIDQIAQAISRDVRRIRFGRSEATAQAG
jgi:peptidoglycan/LPS O-acetylase OafA/YrhL